MSRVIHFEILGDDPDKLGAFYADVLGWKIQSWAGGEYHLVTTGEDGTPGINGGMMRRHFPQAVINTCDVEDLALATARVEEAGGKRQHGPHEIPGVGLHSYFTDPQGNWFGLLQPAAA
jgi:predicted enzyme related to lactoylglutathione lyase